MLIIHEHGEPSHYMGAVAAAKKKQESVCFREFLTLKLIYRGLKKKNLSLIEKAIKDFFFFVFCFLFPNYLKNTNVIIGIAPENWRIIFFNRILKFANVTYHTSWHIWDGSKFPYEPKPMIKKYIALQWQFFLKNTVKNIAVVTQTVRDQLVEHMGVDRSKIEIVYHSYDENIFYNRNDSFRENDVVYVGRLIESKGISDILKISDTLPNLKVVFVGAGSEEEKIKQSVLQNHNIQFLGYISDRRKIAEIFNNTKYLLLPSKRTKDWEELFGMVIIEAMACGCVPLCTDHNGPKIILGTKYLNKNIFTESNFVEKAIQILDEKYVSDKQFLQDQIEALEIAKSYSIDEISKKWEHLLYEC